MSAGNPVNSGNLPPTTSAQAPTNPGADAQFYSWQTFFTLLSGQGTPEERTRYIRARDAANEEADCKQCDERKDWLFQHSPIVRFLRQQINTLSPSSDINSWNVRCRRCTTPQQGGFDSNYGILLCANNLRSRSSVEDALAHEMVHAYDHLRFKVDPDNMRHQACTEIRASMLSGECRFTREFFNRNQWKLTSQLQECIRRRAVRSMMARPSIAGDEGKAQKEVDAVWDSCFADTRPFDEIFR